MNLWTAAHEDGLIVPSWGEAGPSAEWEVRPRPAGGHADLGSYALYWNVLETSFGNKEGPSTRLASPVPNEFYGSIQVYPIVSSNNGSLLSSGSNNGFLYGYSLNTDGTRKERVFNLTTSRGFFSVALGRDIPNDGTVSASVGLPIVPETWNQIDFHVQWEPVILEIKLNCGAYAQSGDNGMTLPSPYHERPQEFVLLGGPSCTEEAWIDNVVLNDTSGSFHNNDVCESGFPGTTFMGAEGGTIYPAPEPLPHVINIDDVGGNKGLQRKLQDNFDSIQRQLLALDPDSDPESFDPMDHA